MRVAAPPELLRYRARAGKILPMKLDSSPIAAIATAPGRGGIGVVRASGKNLSPLLKALFPGVTLKPRHASYTDFVGGDGAVIDQGLALLFNGPHSYTGEDVLELQGHGGPVVLQMLLARVLEAGAEIGLRLAEPGEFTRRAYLNDKLDLAQAEAVADLIDASTEAAAKSATQSLSGAFSQAIHTLVDQTINLRMLVEATLDFPEEEIDFLEKSDARGPLAVADIAIVTPIAGTTRDKVRETIQIEGIPLHIIDTAGIRDPDEEIDQVERIGIERTWGEVVKADVILHLFDASYGPTGADEAIVAAFPEGVPVLRIWNKIDLSGHTPAVDEAPDATNVYLSAADNRGIELLREELLRIAGWQQTGESLYLARERHLIALRAAREHLALAAAHAAQTDQSLDLFAEELRLAQAELSSITGAFSSDDLLGVIFGHFCIGK